MRKIEHLSHMKCLLQILMFRKIYDKKVYYRFTLQNKKRCYNKNEKRNSIQNIKGEKTMKTVFTNACQSHSIHSWSRSQIRRSDLIVMRMQREP